MSNNFLFELGLDDNLVIRLKEYFNKNQNKITLLAKRCKANNFASLFHHGDLMRLAVAIEYAEKYTKPFYIQNDIPLDIFYDTMGDISIWCANNKNKGLKNIGWIQNHLKCELFRLGRLQFQIYECKNKTLDYKCLPFDYGEKVIYVHIPQGERLEYTDCVESIKMANAFFEKFFSSYDYNYYFCESWLLFDNNYKFMEPSCNILQFQSLFDIAISIDYDEQAIERIFGKRRLIKSKYPENTSLQKSAKKYILEGNKLGIGVGIINKNEQ